MTIADKILNLIPGIHWKRAAERHREDLLRSYSENKRLNRHCRDMYGIIERHGLTNELPGIVSFTIPADEVAASSITAERIPVGSIAAEKIAATVWATPAEVGAYCFCRITCKDQKGETLPDLISGGVRAKIALGERGILSGVKMSVPYETAMIFATNDETGEVFIYRIAPVNSAFGPQDFVFMQAVRGSKGTAS